MSRLALYLLGPPRIERDGVPISIHRRKAVALLAYLAVSGGRHSRDALATLLLTYVQSAARRSDNGDGVRFPQEVDGVETRWAICYPNSKGRH